MGPGVAVVLSLLLISEAGTQGAIRCMKDLGCFSSGPPFLHPEHRPLSLLPEPREVIDTRFYLFTRKNPLQFHELKAGRKDAVRTSTLNPELQTRMIVHGWNDNLYFTTWMQGAKNEMLKQGDYNVIIVDWSGSNRIPYSQSAANCRVVGAEIALLVKFLQSEVGFKPEKLHIIGHSLGAHIGGYAGQLIPGLGRITGLDPAGPFFVKMPPETRLDPGDAKLVDVIHSNRASTLLQGFGSSDVMGHLNFFPEGGNGQPGCINTIYRSFTESSISEGIRDLVACDHHRSIEYFLLSINPHGECLSFGVECSSWKAFLHGRCSSCGSDGSRCAIMGFFAEHYLEVYGQPAPLRKFYLKVAGDRPYCLFQYHVVVHLQGGTNKDIVFSVSAQGSEGSFKQLLKFRVEEKKSKHMVSFVMTSKKNIGSLLYARAEGPCSNGNITVTSVKVTTLFPQTRYLEYQPRNVSFPVYKCY